MNKRDFFKFLAVAPIAVPAAAIAKAREGDEPNNNSVNLTLHGTKKTNGEMMRLGPNSGTYIIGNFPENDPDIRVTMSVGNDGHLWLKTAKGNWKRVVTE